MFVNKIEFYKKVLSLITSGTCIFSLYGCSNGGDSESSCNYLISSDETISSEPVIHESSLVTSSIPVSSGLITTTSLSNITTSSTLTTFSSNTTTFSDVIFNDDENSFVSNDLVVLDYFQRFGNDIKDSLDDDSLLDKGKMYFIYCVDFLFYDGDINGVRFDDLTDSAKKQLLIDISNIDGLISSKFPNYKESIGEGVGAAYSKAGDIIKEGSLNLSDFSREKLGEDNYNKIGKYKDMFIDTAFGDWDVFTGLLGSGKQKVKDWYESFRDKNIEGQ